MTKTEKAQEKTDAIAHLRKLCRPGTVVYTTVRRVASSGMSRHISCFVVVKGEIRDVSYRVATAIGWRFSDKTHAIVANGCGMDMGYHTVSVLSYALHGRADRGDGAAPEAQGRPFSPRPGHYRAGYSLRHAWL